MNAKEIFEDHLLIGESVTLEFDSHIALKNFKSALQVYKLRMTRLNASLGIEPADILEGESILATTISSEPLTVLFCVGAKEKKTSFKIISITT
jgi:hypothetical protein